MVLAGITDDRDDWRYELLQDNLARLRAATDARGRRLSVHTVPMPAASSSPPTKSGALTTAPRYGAAPRRRQDGGLLPELPLVNGGVVMPVFDDPDDEAARDTLARLFPDRRVLTVPGREIVLGGGNVHCITQQQPAGPAVGDRTREHHQPAGRVAAAAPGDPIGSDEEKVST